jgi:hypothetical protein
MIDAIVLFTIVCGAAFVVAWLLRPDLRAWIERPKYRFQANVRSYDQAQSERPRPRQGGPHE